MTGRARTARPTLQRPAALAMSLAARRRAGTLLEYLFLLISVGFAFAIVFGLVR